MYCIKFLIINPVCFEKQYKLYNYFYLNIIICLKTEYNKLTILKMNKIKTRLVTSKVKL